MFFLGAVERLEQAAVRCKAHHETEERQGIVPKGAHHPGDHSIAGGIDVGVFSVLIDVVSQQADIIFVKINAEARGDDDGAEDNPDRAFCLPEFIESLFHIAVTVQPKRELTT